MTESTSHQRGLSGDPRFGTFVKLAAVGGASDRLRIALSALGSMLATGFVLGAVNVVAISFGDPGRYRWELLDQEGLHPGVVITLLGLSLPLFMFVGQCIRVGAPARDRRLAGYRMAGATGPEVGRIVVVETALAAGIGALAGVALFVLARAVVPNEPDVAGRLRFPTDVAIHPVAYLIVVLAVIALSSLGTLLALRRTIVDPFGVRRRHAVNVPGLAPVLGTTAALIAFSQLATFVVAPSATSLAGATIGIAVMLLLGIALGVALATAALAQRVGRFVRERTERAGILLAAARLETQPFRSSRSLAAVLVAVMVGTTVQTIRATFLSETAADDEFYTSTFDLLNWALALAVLFGIAGLFVAAAEGITERRRTLAALAAMGTPRSTIVRSVLAEVALPLVPGTVAAAASGIAMGILYSGALYGGAIEVGPMLLGTAVLCCGTIVAALVVTSLSLIFLPAATSPTELRAAA